MRTKRAVAFLASFIFAFGVALGISHFFGQMPPLHYGIFHLEPMLNTGLAFSLSAGSVLTTLLPIATLGFLLFLFVRQSKVSLSELVAFGLIVGAGLANLWERLQLGGVLDYFRVGNLPTVNAADILLTLGVAIYLWENLKHENQDT
jgi:lipoprotein signal peptidase